jgi:AAA domain
MAPLRQHDYRNVDGSIFGRKEKYAHQQYQWLRYQDGKYISGLSGKAPIYHADQVALNLTVTLTEGERDADTLAELGLCTSCGPNGATWDDEWADNFKGKIVYICPDLDEPGAKYARNAGRSLLRVAASVQILDLPTEYNGRPIKDVTDLYEAAGDEFTDAWQELLDAARPFADFHEPGKNGDKEEQKDDDLPKIVTAYDLCRDESIKEPLQVISGLLHQGSKMTIGGGSKAFKTWTMLQLAICIATGRKWLGRFETCGGAVAYINFELSEWAIRDRISKICKAMGIEYPINLVLLNLRGYACSSDKIIPRLEKEIQKGGYVVSFFDPIYKMMGDRDENSARDIAKMLNDLEKFAVRTLNSVIYGSHFSKGNQSMKDAMDRISGSGVFARDPDTIVTMTKHEEDDCFTMDMILRNFPPQEPLVLKHDHPLMTLAEELDPQKIKKPSPKANAHKYEASEITDQMHAGIPIKTGALWGKVHEESDMSRSEFFDLLKELRRTKVIQKTAEGNVK